MQGKGKGAQGKAAKGIPINDDASLEAEADVMGARAAANLKEHGKGLADHGNGLADHGAGLKGASGVAQR